MSGAKRGRKPGTPKTGGRQVGTPNKSTAEQKAALEAAAQQRGVKMIEILESIAERGSPDAARVSAATALLDRGFGRPRQALEHSGTEGEPVQIGLVKCVIVDPKERNAG